MHSFQAVYARMLFAAGVRTQTELAGILGLKQGSISDAKKRGSVPPKWCMRLYDVCGVNVDWLRFGVGPVYAVKKTESFKDSLAMMMSDMSPSAVTVLREPDCLPLETGRAGGLPVCSTVQDTEGTFPEIGHQVFPSEFLGEEVQVFRLLESAMAPRLNKGALVAVRRGENIAEGDVAAVCLDGRLLFRRVRAVGAEVELQADGDASPKILSFPEREWPSVYYGKAVWAFQPL